MTKAKIALAVLLGVLLIPFCYRRAWTAATYPSTKPWPSGTPGVGPYRPFVEQWSWAPLNAWYANVEDGVSGQNAWVWDPNGKLVPYASLFEPGTPDWKIAVAWSVWRNNANNLKRPLRNDTWLQP